MINGQIQNLSSQFFSKILYVSFFSVNFQTDYRIMQKEITYSKLRERLFIWCKSLRNSSH